MFNFIKKALQTIYSQFASQLKSLFTKETIDAGTMHELEKILLSADTGIYTTRSILAALKTGVENGTIRKGTDLEAELEKELRKLVIAKPYNPEADIYLLVGINGSGKTSLAAKLAYFLGQQRKKVLLVAADTFRAAATEQLEVWGKRLGIEVIKGIENQDPASVVYQGCQGFKEGGFDVMIVDTAGRLQTKVNLMKELEKIKKSIEKQLGEKRISTLLTVDSMLGQNSFDQAKIFNESTNVDGIVLTKMDGTGKGGIVFSIIQELQIPVAFITYGEKVEDIKLFEPETYVKELLS